METLTKKPAPAAAPRAAAPSLGGLEAHLGYWLRLVSNHVSGEFARALQAKQMSVAEWVVLQLLDARPGIGPTELAANMGITRGAVSKIVDKLKAKGLATSSTQPAKGRALELRLTRLGQRTLPGLTELADRNDNTFFGALSQPERQTLRKLLGKLVAAHQMQEIPTA